MGKKRSESDEHYLIDLCDEVLGLKARRQHRFEFLIGDPSPTTQRCVRLPVDAFYSERQLVVEIMERQHNEAVALFDGKPTLSGIPRGEQRRRYDERRQTLLPQHGFRLVVLDIADFDITSRKKLRRNRPADLEIVRSKLKVAES
jgi:very-short-patch-repair endonuclease